MLRYEHPIVECIDSRGLDYHYRGICYCFYNLIILLDMMRFKIKNSILKLFTAYIQTRCISR